MGYSVLTMQTVLCERCGVVHVHVEGCSRSSSCQLFLADVPSEAGVGGRGSVMSRQGERRDGVLALASEWLC